MQEKEKLILESAIQLFALKGFNGTSIQEIANECGISKGSVYSYFPSKDALLLEALSDYFNKIEKRLKKMEDLHVSPREKFTKQICSLLEGVMEQKKFFIAQVYEQTTPVNEEIQQVVHEKQNNMRKLYRDGLQRIYGDNIISYLWDLSILLEGMLQTYIRMFYYQTASLNMEKIARYMLDRLDDVAKGFMKREEEPLFSEEMMKQISTEIFLNEAERKKKVNELLRKTKDTLHKENKNKNYVVAIEVLEEELSRKEPREVVIQGMLQNLEELEIVKLYVEQLNDYLIGKSKR